MSDFNTVTTPLDVFFAERAFSPRSEEQYQSLWMLFLRIVNVDTCTPTDVKKFLRTSGWGNSSLSGEGLKSPRFGASGLRTRNRT